LGRHIFIGDRVVLYQARGGGALQIGDQASIFRDCILETGLGGELIIGPGSAIHPRCQVNAYYSSILIGGGVMIAPNCALYSYDHGVLPGEPISQQPLQTKGNISIGDGAWLGVGVIVLSGVRIGTGAVIGAGSVVTQDIPDDAIAVGSPARVIRMRKDLSKVD
jgi:acetyltransferase-like isoleucine patch superfamily enzyme